MENCSPSQQQTFDPSGLHAVFEVAGVHLQTSDDLLNAKRRLTHLGLSVGYLIGMSSWCFYSIASIYPKKRLLLKEKTKEPKPFIGRALSLPKHGLKKMLTICFRLKGTQSVTDT